MDLTLPFRSEAVDERLQRKPLDAQLGVVAIAGHADIGRHLGGDRSPVDLEGERVDGDNRVLEAEAGFPIGDLDFPEEDFCNVHVHRQLPQRQRDRGRFTRFGRGGCRFRSRGGRCRGRVGFGRTGQQVVQRRQVQAVALNGQGTGRGIGGQVHHALEHQLVGCQGCLAEIDAEVLEIDRRASLSHIDSDPNCKGRIGNRSGRVVDHELAHSQVGLKGDVSALEQAHLAVHIERNRDQVLRRQSSRNKGADGPFIEVDGLEGEIPGLLGEVISAVGFKLASQARAALSGELEFLKVEGVARDSRHQADSRLIVLKPHVAELARQSC